MATLQQLRNKLQEEEFLSDEDLELFASLFISYHKFIQANVKLGENVAVEFELSKIISAYMPLVTKNYLGRELSLAELTKEYPFNGRIILNNEVLSMETAMNTLINDVSIADVINDPELAYKQLSKISRRDGINALIDKRWTNKEKALNQARKNLNLLEKNQKAIDNHKFFIVKNDNHKDVDNCDYFINVKFTKDDLVRPPYHVNCQCYVDGISEEEYRGYKIDLTERTKDISKELNKKNPKINGKEPTKEEREELQKLFTPIRS